MRCAEDSDGGTCVDSDGVDGSAAELSLKLLDKAAQRRAAGPRDTVTEAEQGPAIR